MFYFYYSQFCVNNKYNKAIFKARIAKTLLTGCDISIGATVNIEMLM